MIRRLIKPNQPFSGKMLNMIAKTGDSKNMRDGKNCKRIQR
jgi:hypothetical protein